MDCGGRAKAPTPLWLLARNGPRGRNSPRGQAKAPSLLRSAGALHMNGAHYGLRGQSAASTPLCRTSILPPSRDCAPRRIAFGQPRRAIEPLRLAFATAAQYVAHLLAGG